jgi:hypothetical protein
VKPKQRPYQNPKWLRRELKRFGSLSTLCKAHQLSEGTVVSYLRRHPEVKSQVEDLLKKPQSLLKSGKKRQEVGQTRLATLKRHKRDWTVEELQAQNLPLYWNHNWLVEKLTELRTVTAVCQKYGYTVNAVLRYISRQPDLLNMVQQAREEMRTDQSPIFLHLPPELADALETAPTQREVLVAAVRRGIQRAKSRKGGTDEKEGQV